MIRYGIISAAQIVPRFVAGVKESKDGEVVAIAARDYARAQEMAEQLEIPNVYGSYQELLQDTTIDIVYIAVYNKGHYETAKEALLANKHV
jgi:predicted dehydrogenase